MLETLASTEPYISNGFLHTYEEEFKWPRLKSDNYSYWKTDKQRGAGDGVHKCVGVHVLLGAHRLWNSKEGQMLDTSILLQGKGEFGM